MANYLVNKGPTLGLVWSSTTSSSPDTIAIQAGPSFGEQFVTSKSSASGNVYLIDNGPTFGLATSAT